jgi:hypothetical protein
MGCQQDCCDVTLGGDKFNSVAATFNPLNKNSFGGCGRTGATNTWANWSKRTKGNQGIASRAPYGTAAASKNATKKAAAALGGNNTHYSGLGIGPHGHGIGVIPANIGGPHATKRTPIAIVKPTRGSFPTGVTAAPHPTQGRTAAPSTTFCFTCFGTWLAIGAVVLFGAIVSRG